MGDTEEATRTRRMRRFVASSSRWLRGRLTGLPLLAHVVVMLVIAAGVTLGAGQLVGMGYEADQNGLEMFKVALLITGGIGGVVALVVAYRRQRLSEAAERRMYAADAREHGRLFNDRFATASSLLGSDHAASRLSGVYAMAQLADDWDAGRQTCINVLCAYMRMPYTPPRLPPAHDEEPETEEHQAKRREAEQEQQVRHTVMDSIGERLRQDPIDGKTWHGHNFDLSGAVIDGGNWSFAQFTGGEVSFDSAKFTSGLVSFDGAQFSGGEVSFALAQFSGGTVFFDGAQFSGGEVSFALAQFSGGKVFFGVAQFAGGRVFFFDAQFTGGEVDLRLSVVLAVPPVFDDFPDSPPSGLMLPIGSEPE